MKVILDTNISGVYFGGYPYLILEAWNNSRLTLIVSKEILDEYRRIGRMLAEQFPLINFEPMLKFVMVSIPIYSNTDSDFIRTAF